MSYKLASILTFLSIHLFSDVILNQAVQIAVGPINEFEVTDRETELSITSNNLNISGGYLSSDRVTESSYSFTTIDNQQKKITAKLSQALPANVEVIVEIIPPNGASATSITLSDTTPQAVISGISANTKGSSFNITYTMRATTQAAPMVDTAASILFSLENDS